MLGYERPNWELNADELELKRSERQRYQKFLDQAMNRKNASRRHIIEGCILGIFTFVLLVLLIKSQAYKNEMERISIEFQRYKESVERAVRTDY